MCVQRRLRSGWALAQSDQILRCLHELRYPLSAQRRLIRLGGFPGWSKSSLGAQIILLVLSWSGSFYVGHQSYQIDHISCSKNKSNIQTVPAVCSFFGWYCLPNLALLFYGGSRKGMNCTEPKAMSPGGV